MYIRLSIKVLHEETRMIGTIFVWLGAIGCGLLAWLAALVMLPVGLPNITRKALWRVSSVVGILVWVLIAKTHSALDEPDWPWVILYIICWLLTVLGGAMMYVITEDPD